MTPCGSGFYRQVLSMSLNRASRHWISVVFSGGGASPPKQISNSSRLLRAVMDSRGAVAILPAAVVDSTIRTLRVNDVGPGEPDYVLR